MASAIEERDEWALAAGGRTPWVTEGLCWAHKAAKRARRCSHLLPTLLRDASADTLCQQDVEFLLHMLGRHLDNFVASISGTFSRNALSGKQLAVNNPELVLEEPEAEQRKGRYKPRHGGGGVEERPWIPEPRWDRS